MIGNALTVVINDRIISTVWKKCDMLNNVITQIVRKGGEKIGWLRKEYQLYRVKVKIGEERWD